jgi:hypothetical protein
MSNPPIIITRAELERTEKQLRDFELSCRIIDSEGNEVEVPLVPEPPEAFKDE